jgi:hypothetical protein
MGALLEVRMGCLKTRSGALTLYCYVAEIRVASSGMAWKGESETVVTMQQGDIRWAQWIRVARNFQLRVGLVKEAQDRSQRHRREIFDGFQREVRKFTHISGRPVLIFCNI